MTKGLDVSHYQNQAGAIDWVKVRAAGYEFVYIKATEALTLKDAFYQANIDGARKAGLMVGSYHFARANDPVKEADYFLSVVGTLQKYDFLVLDWEIEYSDPDTWCRAFLDRCLAKTTVRPLLYTNADRVKRIVWNKVVAGNYGLIAARYGDNDAVLEPGEEADPDEFPFVVIQQFTSNMTVPGIVGRVDANASNMTLDTLKKYGYQGDVVEPPVEGKSKVLPELRDALKYAHDIEIGEYIDSQDQVLMADHLRLLKDSEMAARNKVDEVRRIVE